LAQSLSLLLGPIQSKGTLSSDNLSDNLYLDCDVTALNSFSLSESILVEDMEQDKRKKSTSSFVGGDAAKVPKWAQKTVTLPAAKRGCHLVTPTVRTSLCNPLAWSNFSSCRFKSPRLSLYNYTCKSCILSIQESIRVLYFPMSASRV